MNLVPLAELVTVTGGGTPSRDKPEYYDGSIPWMTVKDFDDTPYITHAQERISELGLLSSSSNLIPTGSVIISTRMAVGASAINLVPVAINQDLKALSCSKDLDSSYLLYFLMSQRAYLESVANGATVKGITQDKLLALEIPLYSCDEQRRIAAILEAADHERRRRRDAMELSDKFLQDVFVQMFGDPATNPMGWEVAKLGKILASPPQNGLYAPEDDYAEIKDGSAIEMVHMSDLFYGVVKRGNLKRVRSDIRNIEQYFLHDGDLLIARRSLNFEGAAKPCMLPSLSEPLVFESSMIRITPDIKIVDSTYLYHYLSNSEARAAHLLKFVTKSTISGINQDGLNEIEILLPPISLQCKFKPIVDAMNALQTKQQESARQGEHLFQTLLHRAFNGQL